MRSLSRVARRVPRSLGNLGRMSDTHHFKGTINAGVVRWLAQNFNVTNATDSGVFVMRLSDIPNYSTLSSLYEFVRVNRCTLEFMPRYNMTNLPGPAITNTAGTISTNALTSTTSTTVPRFPTFVTGLDEVPLVSNTATSDLQVADSWTSQGGDAGVVQEMQAYQANQVIAADYVRGLRGSKETEIYKKHKVSFIPTFYDYVVSSQEVTSSNNPRPASGIFQAKKKQWLNCNYLLQASSSTSTTEVESLGPDMFGPVYAFSSGGAGTGSTNVYVELYDVKLHYSISTKRYKGVSGGGS